MQPEEIDGIAAALGTPVIATRTLAGGFSHETCLLTLADGQVVARFGGPDPAIEAGVMAVARRYAPVPQVLLVLPTSALDENARPAMVLEYVAGTPLSQVLAATGYDGPALAELGAEVGRVVAGNGAATFDRRGFFVDGQLTVRAEPPWSQQLPEVAATCMDATPPARLDLATRRAWVDLCTAHAPALVRIDSHTRLVHADINPKNILVTQTPGGWRVDAVLDWEFSYSGCPYGDAANMARFGADYPGRFLDGGSDVRHLITLRPADASDAEAVAAIWSDGWRDGHLGHVCETLVAVRTPESFRSRAARRVGDTVVAVAGAEQQVAGFIMVVGDEVEQVYVSADHRGSGMAAVLLAEAERLVAAGGHRRAWLAVAPGNARARRFYQRSGWADEGLFSYTAMVPDGTSEVPCHRYVKQL